MQITNVTEKSAISILNHYMGDVEMSINHIVTTLAAQSAQQQPQKMQQLSLEE